MTQDIRNYTFDFEQEAGGLLRKLGAAGNHIVFVDVKVTAPKNIGEEATVDIPGALCGAGIDGGTANKILGSIINFYTDYNNPESLSSQCIPMSQEKDGKRVRLHAIALRNTTVEDDFGKEHSPLMRLTSLLHETGHVLCAELKKEDDESPIGEIAADAYMALCLLERFGKSAVPLISHVSWLRSLNCLHGDTLHLTSMALDKIVADYSAGKLPDLNADKVVGLAKTYATDWTPKSAELIEARKSFTPVLETAAGMTERRIETLLTGTFLSSPNAITDYVTAKTLMPYLVQPDATYRGSVPKLTHTEKKEFISTIRQRAKTGLSGHFGARATHEQPTAILNMLQVRRFPGQAFKYKAPSLS